MALLAVVSFAGQAQAYLVTTFDGISNANAYFDWVNAISPTTPVVENFDDTTLEPGLSISEIGGTGTIALGVYKNIVDYDRWQVFNFAGGMTAFGGWFNLAGPGGPGSSIDLIIEDNNQTVMNISNTAAGQFFGFIADSAFNGVMLKEPTNAPEGWIETYVSVDVALAPAVPEPATMLLFGTGLAGLAGISRRRKK